MVSHYKPKVIQVQKPAQSLQAFQKKVATGQDLDVGILKPVLIAAGILAVGVGGVFGYRAWRANTIETFQTSLADLQLEAQGNEAIAGSAPTSPQDLEQRMRERLPKLEALVRTAPGSEKAMAEGVLASWKVQLGDASAPAAPATDPWGRLRFAQRQLAMGQGQEALNLLQPLRAAANPDQAWAPVYWSTLLQTDQLLGTRDQAWKDLGDYKARFKDQADPSLERILAGV